MAKSAVPPGVWCPVLSLYQNTPRQEIDIDATYKYFSYLIHSGVNGLVLQGSTAEAPLLSTEERIAIIHTARQAAKDAGVPHFPLVAGISGQSTNESLRLADDAVKAGADFGLLLPPSFWAKTVSNDVIVDFYREVADHSKIPIIVYNFPGVTSGVDLGVDVLSELAQHPNIVGVKLTCANAGKVTCLTARYTPDQFALFAGQSDWLLPCLIGGGVGCVTGIGNVFPKCVSRLYSLWQAGKIEEAKSLQGRVALVESACKKGLAATKFGASHFTASLAGLSEETLFHPRKPYKPANKQLQQSTISVMQDLEELEKSLPDVVAGLESNSVHTNGSA